MSSSPSTANAVAWYETVPPRVLLALVLTAVVSVLVFAVSELAFSEISTNRVEGRRAVEAQAYVLRVREQLLAAESSQRGYLITHEDRYLAPYDKAVESARSAQSSLLSTLGDQSSLRKEAVQLGALVEEKLDELNVTLHMARDRQPGMALATLHTDVGLTLMEKIARTTRTLDDELGQQSLLRTNTLTRLFQQQRWGVGLVVFLNLAFLAILGTMMVRNFHEREQSRRRLKEHAQQLETAVAERTQELSALSTYLQNNAERERSSLARDLHDEFGAILTSAKLDVAWLQGHAASSPEPVQERLSQLSNALDEAVNLKRRVIENLRPSLLDHLGLAAAIQWHVQEACDRADIACDVTMPEDGIQVPSHIAIDLFRLVQEALNNTVKYAQARLFEVNLIQHDGNYILTMKDDGIGIAQFQPDHLTHGLAGMQHRVRALQGRFTVQTSPGQGTCIEAVIPVAATVNPSPAQSSVA
ncbi:MAG TPA: CHASE3 domain-containing protein [Candidatus Aquabacterium excrementipullorum]|nr:CHASE3 domain-containing protein [Candidatus Aquabacterium excrementipullorum]